MSCQNILSKQVFVIVLFLVTKWSYSQSLMPFKERYRSFLKGDMVVVSNSISNRNGSSKDCNDFDKLNDEYDMKYIDIDSDSSTFSSSSADLVLDNPSSKKVVYAALYWSATYKYSIGAKKGDEFIAKDVQRDVFNTIKIKLPNAESYIDIAGETIFDGLNNQTYSSIAPYAVYANITTYLQNAPSLNGTYTVANVKSTQGFLSGGVAAGWTLFILYEDSSMTGKFISSYDGFVGVGSKFVDIHFTGFETLEKGNINARVACAALEGDSNLFGDRLLFSSQQTGNFISLKNKLRPANNFFNSSITSENEIVKNRKPASINTLGYDAFLMSIPNANNLVIQNNATEATLRLNSNSDRYFMFFTAFGIEITDKSLTSASALSPLVLDSTSTNQVRNLTESKSTISKNTYAADKVTNVNSKIANLEIRPVSIKNQKKGYYLVANVFSKPVNTKNFIQFLKTKAIEASYFSNPDNNYEYVYLKDALNKQEVIDYYLSTIKDTYNDQLWILEVNIDNESKNTSDVKASSEFDLINRSTNENSKTADLEIRPVSIKNQEKGYYLVANVFSKPINTKNFIQFLKSNAIEASYFSNPTTNYEYVYLKYAINEQEVKDFYLSKLKGTYHEKLWILAVNIDR